MLLLILFGINFVVVIVIVIEVREMNRIKGILLWRDVSQPYLK